jgi:probable rRNA maturation factor
MNIEIFQPQLIIEHIPEWKIGQSILDMAIIKIAESLTEIDNINIIFVSPEEIKKLNNEFREKNEETDVLSFNVDTQLGEVYVCPEYIARNYKGELAVEEILRSIIHGILHLVGYEHENNFDGSEESMKEEMYRIQEDLLNKLKTELGI